MSRRSRSFELLYWLVCFAVFLLLGQCVVSLIKIYFPSRSHAQEVETPQWQRFTTPASYKSTVSTATEKLFLRIDGNDPRLAATFDGDAMKFVMSGREVWRGQKIDQMEVEVTGLDKIFDLLMDGRKRIKSRRFSELFDAASSLKLKSFGTLMDLSEALLAGSKLTAPSGKSIKDIFPLADNFPFVFDILNQKPDAGKLSGKDSTGRASSEASSGHADLKFAIELEPDNGDDDDDDDHDGIEIDDAFASELWSLGKTNLDFLQRMKKSKSLPAPVKSFLDQVDLDLLSDLLAMTDPNVSKTHDLPEKLRPGSLGRANLTKIV